LIALGFQRLELKYDRTLSNFVSNFNLRRYTEAVTAATAEAARGALDVVEAFAATVPGRGSHSPTSQLN
jgi:hypothetical protein